MRYLILISYLFFTPFFLFSQQSKEYNFISDIENNRYIFPNDSCWRSYKNKTNIAKAIYLRNRAKYYLKNDSIPESMKIIMLSNNLFNSTGNRPELGKNYLFTGDMYEQSNMLQKAKQEYLKAKDMLEVDSSSYLFNAYISVARIYDKMGNHSQAVLYIEKAEQISNTDNASNISELMNFKAIVYKRAKHYNTALSIIDSAIRINKNISDTLAMAVNYTTKGNIHFAKHDYNQALNCYKLSYSLSKTNNNKKVSAIRGINLASVMHMTNRHLEAYRLYDEMYKQGLDYSDYNIMAAFYYNLFLLNTDYDSSGKKYCFTDSALHYCKANKDYKQTSSIYLTLADKAFNREDINDLYSNFVNAKKYLDSANTKYNQNYFYKYKLETDLNAICLSDNETKKQLENLQKQKQIQLFIIVLIAIIFTLVIILFVVIIRHKRGTLNNKQQELERTNYKLNLSKEKANAAYNFSEQLQHNFNTFILKIKHGNSINSQIIKELNNHSDTNTKRYNEHCIKMRSIFEDILAVQDEFEENFVEIKARIKVHFPDLTKNEELVCFLLKLNYSVKEIAAQMNISAQGVEMIKYRMRKKNGFESMDKFMEHLKSI